MQKILKPQQLLERDLKNLILITGTFDILHIGHIHFLRQAKKLCNDTISDLNNVGVKEKHLNPENKLLVITHTDKIIKKIKGNTKPIFPLNDRLEMLAELNSVDYVSYWDGWETITDFVLDLKPKYIAVTEKSYEYSNSNSKLWKGPGWEDVTKKINAKLIKIPITNNISSGKILKLLK